MVSATRQLTIVTKRIQLHIQSLCELEKKIKSTGAHIYIVMAYSIVCKQNSPLFNLFANQIQTNFSYSLLQQKLK